MTAFGLYYYYYYFELALGSGGEPRLFVIGKAYACLT